MNRLNILSILMAVVITVPVTAQDKKEWIKPEEAAKTAH